MADFNSNESYSDDCHSFYCAPCRREFVSRKALLSHLSQSSQHSFYCAPCDRKFVSRMALLSHLSHSSLHPFYCAACDRDFGDENSFRFHLASKWHTEPVTFCPKCRSGFVSAEGLVKHVEMSRCYSISNKKIVDAVRHWEESTGNPNSLTVPRICGDNNPETSTTILSTTTYATEASFDGKSYICPVCRRGFQELMNLNQHFNSNVHEASEFHCRKCSRKFKVLSALVAHVESEACGAMTSSTIRNLVENCKSKCLTYIKSWIGSYSENVSEKVSHPDIILE